MESEVARIRNQIETECVALKRALTSFSLVARHDIIQRKYTSIGNSKKRLEELVGKESADEIAGGIYVEVMKDGTSP